MSTGGEDHPTLTELSVRQLHGARPSVLPSLGPVLVLGREEVDTGPHSVAFQTWGPHPVDEEEERSSCLKALLSNYFEKEPAGEQAERDCEEEEEEEEEDLGDAKVSKSTFIGSWAISRYFWYMVAPV